MNNIIPDEALPSNYSRPASLELSNNMAIFKGYQEFELTKNSIRTTENDLEAKRRLLEQFFTPRFFAERSFLDLGANSGFFSFLALQNQATNAIAVDIDDVYLEMIRRASGYLDIHNIVAINENVAELTVASDIVLALSIVHWLFSCSAQFGSLDNVVSKLSSLADYMLIVEWIEPNDPAILSLGHINWNQDCITGEYSRCEFEKALAKYFKHFEIIGNSQDSRVIYAAYKSMFEIDLSCPFPFIEDKKYIISSRLTGVVERTEYWSVVYKPENGTIIKQASLDLAYREGEILKSLEEYEYFPHVLNIDAKGSYSTLTLQEINGYSLGEYKDLLNASEESVKTFLLHCLNVLEALESRKIIHRDIHFGNLLIYNNVPVLIDFGWAVSPTSNIVAPNGLHQEPSGGSCDVYSMGKILESSVCEKYNDILVFISIMTEPDLNLRVKDIKQLKTIFKSIFLEQANDSFNYVARKLIFQTHFKQINNENLDKLNTELQNANRELQNANRELQSANAELQSANAELQNKYLALEQTKAVRWARVINKILGRK